MALHKSAIRARKSPSMLHKRNATFAPTAGEDVAVFPHMFWSFPGLHGGLY